MGALSCEDGFYFALLSSHSINSHLMNCFVAALGVSSPCVLCSPHPLASCFSWAPDLDGQFYKLQLELGSKSPCPPPPLPLLTSVTHQKV